MESIKHVLNALNRYDKKIIPYSIAVALFSVAVPFAGIFLPRIILDLLEISAPPMQILVHAGGFTLLLVVLGFFNEFFRRNLNWHRWNSITHGSFREVFWKTLDCEYSYLEDPEKQALWARIKENLYGYENCYTNTITALVGIAIGVLGFSLYSFVLSMLNIWIVLFLTITSTINYFVLRRANRYEHENKGNWTPLEKRISYLLKVSGSFDYGKDIRLYSMRPWFIDLAHGLFSQRSKWDGKVQKQYYLAKVVNAGTIILRDGIAYALLIYMVAQGRVTVGEFMLFFGAITGFSAFITGIADNVASLGKALPYVKDVRDYMDGGTVIDPENPVEVIDLLTPPSIEFRNVSFSYDAEKKVLDNISFKINAGEKLAIVGVNGAGKTTIVKLICKFYVPEEGEVLINGIDTRQYRAKDLFNMFSAVFQDALILPVSLAENVTPNKSDMEGIRNALEKAELWDYVSKLPNGMNSYMTKAVEETGLILSGGERQKLILARALYKDAPALLLDEPTSALDPIAESAVYEKYHELTLGKTSVFISHRLASTRFCYKVLLIADGKIAESGTHDELMVLGGQYANMYEVQSHYYNERREVLIGQSGGGATNG